MRDPVGQETAENSCDDACREEHVDVELEFMAFVVHRDEIDAAWVETGLEGAEENTTYDEAGERLAHPLAHGDNAPGKDDAAEPGPGMHLLQDYIAGDF